jgi:hypothetical protein
VVDEREIAQLKPDDDYCCCPLIPLAVSSDDSNGKITVKLVQQGISAKLPRWTMLRLGNTQAERCSFILLACWFCPLISLTRLFFNASHHIEYS